MVSPGPNLLRRAKLAGEPRRGPLQLQRINPVAFQAAKCPRPLTVYRHHRHHQAVAVLAPLR
jgi:hypothetical protein